jgi:hypothetical protein
MEREGSAETTRDETERIEETETEEVVTER